MWSCNANKYFDRIGSPFNENLFSAAVSHLANFNSYRAEKNSPDERDERDERRAARRCERDGRCKKEVIKKAVCAWSECGGVGRAGPSLGPSPPRAAPPPQSGPQRAESHRSAPPPSLPRKKFSQYSETSQRGDSSLLLIFFIISLWDSIEETDLDFVV